MSAAGKPRTCITPYSFGVTGQEPSASILVHTPFCGLKTNTFLAWRRRSWTFPSKLCLLSARRRLIFGCSARFTSGAGIKEMASCVYHAGGLSGLIGSRH
jgi:hypothetical protein